MPEHSWICEDPDYAVATGDPVRHEHTGDGAS
jgi:hypothetical protein